ncbi:MAG: exo-alpha-sialidase [Planctomycetes bacterium]|nr:exo-alpha-sialidase [Planctomycetota bacterium]
MLLAPLLTLLVQAPTAPRAVETPPWIVVHSEPSVDFAGLGSPQLVLLPSGEYVAGFTYVGHHGTSAGLMLAHSVNRGLTWTAGDTVKGSGDASLFVHDKFLWAMGIDGGLSAVSGQAVIRRSSDGGRTWTQPTDEAHGLLRGKESIGSDQGAFVVHGERVWRPFLRNTYGEDSGARLYVRVASASLKSDWLDAASWRWSDEFESKMGEEHLANGGIQLGALTADQLMLFLGRQSSTLPVLDVDPEGWRLSPHKGKSQARLPVNACSSRIARDAQSGRFLALIHADTMDTYDPRTRSARSLLVLWDSLDLVTWELKGILLQDVARDHYDFGSADWAVDGDDLLVLAQLRSLREDEKDTCEKLVFLRVPDFRTRTADSPALWGSAAPR